MVTFFVILGVITVLYLIIRTKGVVDNTNNFGPPSFFLNDLIQKLKADFPEHHVLVESQTRYKIKLQSKSFSLQLDFIYQRTNIQVCITLDAVMHTVKTFNCPYSPDVVEQEVMQKYKEAFGFPQDLQ
jgi:hypothetical protein